MCIYIYKCEYQIIIFFKICFRLENPFNYIQTKAQSSQPSYETCI